MKVVRRSGWIVTAWVIILLLAGGLELLGEETKAAEQTEPRLDFRFYGYVKLDASWDESLIDSGNFARWVVSPSNTEGLSEFNMTARQTRLGIDLKREPDEGLALDGKVEIDFYGGGAENKNHPQLRHAYVDLKWAERDLRLRAGQASDIVSPLVPTTLNYTVAWWVGNIGYRRPLAALTKSFGADDSAKTRLTAGISRTIGDDFGAVDGDTGADSGLATFQGALSRSFTVGEDRSGRFGISGHWGRENLEEELGEAANLDVDSWSVNVDLVVPLGSRTTFKGEAWTGENLDDYFGGIAQGIDYETGEAIEASGGWASLEFRAGKVLTSVGYGMDDPDDEVLPAEGRARNQAVWANVIWDIRKVLSFGVEASYWETDYVDIEDGSSFRLQTSLIYRFSK